MIPPTEFQLILETSSSPEIIAASLNEAERRYSSSQKKPHGNTKYVFPFWKTCAHCSAPFQAHTKEQAARNKTCSKVCANAVIGAKVAASAKPMEMHKGKSAANCVVCGTEFWRNTKHLKRVKKPVCSYECNGVLRGEEWKAHAHTGRENWTQESEAALVERMTGETNPAWKGGVTYRNRKGNYVSVRYVRCPVDFLPMSRKDGYVMEHRLNVAMAMGRLLERTECVHHIDHDPLNNTLANLMLFATNKDHKLFEHGTDIKPLWDGSLLSDIAA